METVFYIAAAVAVISTSLVVIQLKVVHALLYLVVSLLAVAVMFFLLGAPFIAALEVIIYAGAIMVLFVFVIMMLNLGAEAARQERAWLNSRMWIGPGALSLVLLADLVYIFEKAPAGLCGQAIVRPQQVGEALFAPYLIGVELASVLLLSGLVGAYFLGRRSKE